MSSKIKWRLGDKKKKEIILPMKCFCVTHLKKKDNGKVKVICLICNFFVHVIRMSNESYDHCLRHREL